MPPEDDAVPAEAQRLGAWDKLIKSVTTVFGFLTLIVLAFDAALFFWAANATDGQRIFFFSVQVLVLLTLVGIVVFLGVSYPHLLQLRDPYDRHFANQLGQKFYEGLEPYLKNLDPKDIDDALLYWRDALRFSNRDVATRAEREFADRVGSTMLSSAERNLKRSLPPGIKQ